MEEKEIIGFACLIVSGISLFITILFIVAAFRILDIYKVLMQVLQKLTELGALEIEIDHHRRDEFNALHRSGR